jgi:hypothetical protein
MAPKRSCSHERQNGAANIHARICRSSVYHLFSALHECMSTKGVQHTDAYKLRRLVRRANVLVLIETPETMEISLPKTTRQVSAMRAIGTGSRFAAM